MNTIFNFLHFGIISYPARDNHSLKTAFFKKEKSALRSTGNFPELNFKICCSVSTEVKSWPPAKVCCSSSDSLAMALGIGVASHGCGVLLSVLNSAY